MMDAATFAAGSGPKRIPSFQRRWLEADARALKRTGAEQREPGLVELTVHTSLVWWRRKRAACQVDSP